MIPVQQTILHDPDNGKHGNCLSAVLASLLHLPIESVPVFSNPVTWAADLNAWLRQFNLAYLIIKGSADNHRDFIRSFSGISGVWHELSGTTARSSDVLHACVAKDVETVFDPHPDATGLAEVQYIGFFVVLEPWRLTTAPSTSSN